MKLQILKPKQKTSERLLSSKAISKAAKKSIEDQQKITKQAAKLRAQAAR